MGLPGKALVFPSLELQATTFFPYVPMYITAECDAGFIDSDLRIYKIEILDVINFLVCSSAKYKQVIRKHY